MIIFILFSIAIVFVLYLILGLQLITLGDFVRSGFESKWKITFDLNRYREYPSFLFLILFLSGMTVLLFLWNTLLSKTARDKYKNRHLTKKEKKDSSHLASTHEAKRETTRIEFDKNGHNLGDKTLRGYADLFFDPFKRIYNTILSGMRFSDIHKLNVLHSWMIDGQETDRRGGPPIITRKRRIWVDAGDFHSLVLGATRAGKTFLVILITIIAVAMGGESMIIMDVKGELYRWVGGFLKMLGYEIWNTDFVNPKKSLRWNPFGIVIKKHREAYHEYEKQLELPEYKKVVEGITVNDLLIRKLKKKVLENTDDITEITEKINVLKEENNYLREMLPEPDYSEAQELAADIAVRLCIEENSRDPFWPDAASEVLEGYINFLLEERIPDGKGGFSFLPDEMINMRSVKALHNAGKKRINPEKNDGCSTILEYYLTHYRKRSDMSVTKLGEFSVMPENTKGSISSVLSNRIRYFLANENILKMTSVSDFDLKQLGEKKTALFISVHDEKGTYHKLPSILISQIYEELIKSARNQKNLRLKVPVYVIWDEFANGAPWKNIVEALTAGLSRGVRFMLAIQDYSQLSDKYGELAKTIKSNCQNTYYLLAGENATLEEVSKMCGTRIRWDENKKDKVKEPVLSTDALRKLSFGQAVIIRQRMNPYITWLKPFDKYGFDLPETDEIKEKSLPKTPVFDILTRFNERRKINNSPNKSFEIEDVIREKHENEINEEVADQIEEKKSIREMINE